MQKHVHAHSKKENKEGKEEKKVEIHLKKGSPLEGVQGKQINIPTKHAFIFLLIESFNCDSNNLMLS
jgi:hypothetical protein